MDREQIKKAATILGVVGLLGAGYWILYPEKPRELVLQSSADRPDRKTPGLVRVDDRPAKPAPPVTAKPPRQPRPAPTHSAAPPRPNSPRTKPVVNPEKKKLPPMG